MSRGRLLRAGAWLTMGNTLSAVAPFLRNIAVARLVSIEDFGIAAVLAMILSVVETLSNLGIDRLIVQAPDGDDPQLQGTAHALQVARGVLGSAVLLAAATLLAAVFKIPQATWGFQVLAAVPLIRGFQHLDTVRYQREMRYGPTFWVDALPQILSLVLAVALAYWLRDYAAIVWAMLVQTLAQTMLTHLLASRPYRWVWDRLLARRVMSFGWPLMANGLLMFAIFQGDRAVVAVAFTPDVVGWYSAAFMLSMGPALLLTSVMQGLWLPTLSRSQDDPNEFQRRYVLVVQSCLGAGLMAAAFFALFGPELLVGLFGEPYRSGTEVAVLLGVTQGIRVAKAGQFISSIAIGRTKDPLISNIGRGLTLALAVSLVAFGHGPFAVALAGLLGEGLSYAIAIRLWSLRREGRVTTLLPQLSATASLVGVSCWIGANLRSVGPSLGSLAAGVAWLVATAVLFLAVAPMLRFGVMQLVGKGGGNDGT